MSRVRYYHIALSHIALFRLSLLTERNILALAQNVSLQTIHIRWSYPLIYQLVDRSGESYAGRPTESYEPGNLPLTAYCSVVSRTRITPISNESFLRRKPRRNDDRMSSSDTVKVKTVLTTDRDWFPWLAQVREYCIVRKIWEYCDPSIEDSAVKSRAAQ